VLRVAGTRWLSFVGLARLFMFPSCPLRMFRANVAHRLCGGAQAVRSASRPLFRNFSRSLAARTFLCSMEPLGSLALHRTRSETTSNPRTQHAMANPLAQMVSRSSGAIRLLHV
jgi:hypothetical protein